MSNQMDHDAIFRVGNLSRFGVILSRGGATSSIIVFGLERKGGDSQAHYPDRYFHDVSRGKQRLSHLFDEMAIIYRLMVLQYCPCSTRFAFSLFHSRWLYCTNVQLYMQHCQPA